MTIKGVLISLVAAALIAAWAYGFAKAVKKGPRIWVDQETGCQYFDRGWGGFPPRLGKDGKQIC